MARAPAPTNNRVEVRIARLKHATGLDLPRYQTAGAAGLDLAAAVPVDQPMRLAPMQRALVPTGLTLAIPPGCVNPPWPPGESGDALLEVQPGRQGSAARWHRAITRTCVANFPRCYRANSSVDARIFP